MKTLKVKWTGLRPLVMANPQAVNVVNPYAKAGREINNALKAAKKKDNIEIMEEKAAEARKNDFESSAYFDEAGFYLPDTVVLACIKEAAKAAKKGKDIDRSVLMSESQVRIHAKVNHKTLEAAFEDDSFRLEGPCKIPPKTGVLVWKCRAMIPTGWSFSFTLEYDDNQITSGALQSICETAGNMIGVGGWRPKFGRFISEVVS